MTDKLKGKWIGSNINRIEQDMTDDWSLKVKGVSNDTMHWGNPLSEEEYFWYHEREIETLRNKLIDDIKKYKDFQGHHYIQIDMIDIINKSFGVD